MIRHWPPCVKLRTAKAIQYSLHLENKMKSSALLNWHLTSSPKAPFDCIILSTDWDLFDQGSLLSPCRTGQIKSVSGGRKANTFIPLQKETRLYCMVFQVLCLIYLKRLGFIIIWYFSVNSLEKKISRKYFATWEFSLFWLIHICEDYNDYKVSI